ncbi:OmpA family protein [Dechloromonas sp. A34]|uniref:OmpA family protein n=1 Tax=Dechloromonas sp. A34 TaxID=447588 RepID=UPI002248FAD8|nr:OmpA family protein [Dechloromonas sp. A34]
MAANDDDESTAVIVGVLAGIMLAVVAVVYGASAGKYVQPAAKSAAEQADIAPVGEALVKVYFAVGAAALDEADKGVVAKTLEALGANPNAIVLLSGFHDMSGDPAKNAELAKHRAQSVRDALVAGGVSAERIKFRKPESTLGTGSPEEGRRVEIRVQ